MQPIIKILIEMKKKGWWKLFVYCNIYFDIIDIIVSSETLYQQGIGFAILCGL